jgi:hypothetical protein
MTKRTYRYTKSRRDYDLLDPTAPAYGHVRRMRSNVCDSWIWSPEPTHEALIDREQWQQVQVTQTREAALRVGTTRDTCCAARRLHSLRPAHDGPQRRGGLGSFSARRAGASPM